jgi:glycosyltransferase involved in cell wall biosynthesis
MHKTDNVFSDATKGPLVSIITPVRNGIKYLEECIQSVLNQTYANIEHVFIDGGSSDGTVEMLTQYQSKYPGRIRFTSEPDSSAGEAWNKGWKIARGDILGWLGADDVYEPDAIMTVAEFFQTRPEAYFVFGGCNFINEKGRVIGKFITRDFDLKRAINNACYIPCPSAFYRREVIEKVGILDTRERGVELDYWIRVGKAFKIYRIEKSLSNFRMHKESFSNSREAAKTYAREGFTINQRHGGSIFSTRVFRYLLYKSVILAWILPAKASVYRFLVFRGKSKYVHPTYKQQKSYYDTKWLSQHKRKKGGHEACLAEFIIYSIRAISSKSNHRLNIIDLGCGRGWITDALSRYGDVVGIDLSVSTAEKLYPNLKFIEANIVTDAIEGKFDVVVSSEVIEHLSSEDQRIYIRKTSDLLDDTGCLILTTPNKPQVENWFKAVSISREQLQPIENWLDKESLEPLLAPYFKITGIGSTVFYPALVRKYRYLRYMYVFAYTYLKLYKIINRLFKKSQRGLYLNVVARKKIPPEAHGNSITLREIA